MPYQLTPRRHAFCTNQIACCHQEQYCEAWLQCTAQKGWGLQQTRTLGESLLAKAVLIFHKWNSTDHMCVPESWLFASDSVESCVRFLISVGMRPGHDGTPVTRSSPLHEEASDQEQTSQLVAVQHDGRQLVECAQLRWDVPCKSCTHTYVATCKSWNTL